ncbi:hypothetical protein EJ05DRAFT_541255 [Pseudovirgaria hyperparasitica]|uniref:Uncharacterized protein n=1 Tax=Pseudovirgaria hyperparasitica TaxID=470096 RepID=A0A6A6VTW1_9PEZI|nr:uncharacterized protein EJ05DRAFT_541255 [Pseudovirgaria hyperparasitica]KAF2754128.1 hypothetical protein EJ05DRAFT_541255 [Pseudovirgaria hyperparasitica]
MATKPGNSSYDAKQMAFSLDTMATVLAAQGITSIPNTAYAMMSALDGQRTVNSFQHQFRPVVKRAKEIKAQMDSDAGIPIAVTPKKRGTAAKDDSEEATPTKKPRATPKKKAVANGSDTPSKRKVKAKEPEMKEETAQIHDGVDEFALPDNMLFPNANFSFDFNDGSSEDAIKQEPAFFQDSMLSNMAADEA